jgi:hypothetical protein
VSGATPATATDYARTVDAAAVDWTALQAAAYARYPTVLGALRARGRPVVRPERSRWAPARGVAGFVVLLAPLLLPGLVAIGERLDAPEACTAVAVALSVAHLVLRVAQWRGVRRDGVPSPGEALYAWFAAAFGLIAVGFALLPALLRLDRAWSLAASAVFLLVAVANAAWAVQVRRLHVLARDPASGLSVRHGDVEAEFRALPRADREAIGADLRSARAVLEQRGIDVAALVASARPAGRAPAGRAARAPGS